MALTTQQCAFFETFGYLALPGLMANDLGWINEGFEEIFERLPERHNGTRRTIAGTDSSERLCHLLDHPGIIGVASSLMGEDFNYLGGDANYYVGDSGWHSDGWHAHGLYIKMAFYLDPVKRDTGCLRVIPGTHHVSDRWANDAGLVAHSEERLGLQGADIPSIALESTPGDVVVFNHNLKHASFGGGNRRRMFTLNLCSHARTLDEMQELRAFINSAARFWVTQCHSDTMRQTASPERMRHLRQVIENEDELPELVRIAKQTMPAPANG